MLSTELGSGENVNKDVGHRQHNKQGRKPHAPQSPIIHFISQLNFLLIQWPQINLVRTPEPGFLFLEYENELLLWSSLQD